MGTIKVLRMLVMSFFCIFMLFPCYGFNKPASYFDFLIQIVWYADGVLFDGSLGTRHF